MPGFLGRIGTKNSTTYFSENINDKLITKSLIIDDLFIEQRTVNKFTNDKIFMEDTSFFILTEGVILNCKELTKKYKCDSLYKSIIRMYTLNGNDFFKEFRGSFSGVFFDKVRNKKIIYTDQIGDKQVFYSKLENALIFGSEINYLVDFYNRNKFDYTLNINSSYCLLSLGYLLEDNTLFNEIKKLLPGHYVLLENNTLNIIQYYKLDNAPNHHQSEDEIIENIDFLFRQAIKRAFDKDLEYGYKHLVALSGGLDSRMTTWVASSMGYGANIVNFTFSQSNYLDEVIPKSIASDLKHDWIFKSLDNGLFLKNIENSVKICSGGALYYGLAHAKSCLDLIDKDSFGIVHSGQLGDVVIGTFYSSIDPDKKFSMKNSSYSQMLIHEVEGINLIYNYENEELFKFYGRGFNGANQGLLVYHEYTETYSPFYDLDFLEYCLKIPVNLRYSHYIYFKWILRKYPNAAKYVWEKTQEKITAKKIKLFNRELFIKQLPKSAVRFLLRKFNISKSSINTKNHMNPLDYWYTSNEELKNYMDNYYESNIERLQTYRKLKTDCEALYREGSSIEKIQVLTLLSVLKLYFGDENER